MRFEPTDWLPTLKKVMAETSEKFAVSQLPSSQRHACPIPLLFLADLDDSRARHLMRSGGDWLVRDGEIPLREFFAVFPKPPSSSKARLLINESLRHLVPIPWLSYTGYVGLRLAVWKGLSQTFAKPFRSQLLLTDLVNQNGLRSKPEQEARVKRALEFARSSGLKKIHALSHFESFSSRQPTSMSQASALFLKYGIAIVWMRTELFDSLLDLRDFEVLRLEGTTWVADDFLTHVALSKGARLAKDEVSEIDENQLFIRLSPYHGYVLNE